MKYYNKKKKYINKNPLLYFQINTISHHKEIKSTQNDKTKYTYLRILGFIILFFPPSILTIFRVFILYSVKELKRILKNEYRVHINEYNINVNELVDYFIEFLKYCYHLTYSQECLILLLSTNFIGILIIGIAIFPIINNSYKIIKWSWNVFLVIFFSILCFILSIDYISELLKFLPPFGWIYYIIISYLKYIPFFDLFFDFEKYGINQTKKVLSMRLIFPDNIISYLFRTGQNKTLYYYFIEIFLELLQNLKK